MPRYILYARKSSESEDRQIQSIDSQIRELREHASAEGLEITSVLSESRSAKSPGRPVFGQMMNAIAREKADGILCWKLDRLARNPVDGGALIWAVDEGKLKVITTRERSFDNTGNDKFWMQLEFGMAKKYIDDLSENVKRGLRAKLIAGWLPGLAPLGYKNDKANNTIVRDPERFPLIRKVWDLVLSGKSPASLLDVVNVEWGFRTPKYKRLGGKPMARSTLYRILTNPFYCGILERDNDTYPGAHEAMVSKDEFDKVQELLGRPNRQGRKRRSFPFTGLIRCGECGAMVTAEEKVNRYGSHYTYYHCTKRKTAARCGQGVIRVEALEEQIRDALRRIRIDEDVMAWGIRRLKELRASEESTHAAQEAALKDASSQSERSAQALLEMRLRGLVTDEEYAAEKRVLVADQMRLRAQMEDQKNRVPRWFEPSANALFFASWAPKRFPEAEPDERRQIVMALGSNLQLRDGILLIQAQPPFEQMLEGGGLGAGLGTLTVSLVHPREVFRPAIMYAAASIVLVHNHPSGNPTPSREDIEITGRLAEAGRVLGIDLLDHMIVGSRGRFESLREMGYL